MLELQEFIPTGQRIAEFSVAIPGPDEAEWQTIATGTTIGHKRILPLDNVTTKKIRVTFSETTDQPAISEIAVYKSDS